MISFSEQIMILYIFKHHAVQSLLQQAVSVYQKWLQRGARTSDSSATWTRQPQKAKQGGFAAYDFAYLVRSAYVYLS